MRFLFLFIAAWLCACGISGCASSNPNSEIMTDTSSQTRQTITGATQARIPASELGPPTTGDQ
jgi:hypothetical protein